MLCQHQSFLLFWDGRMSCVVHEAADVTFMELRRKVRESELFSAATLKLLKELHFNGKLSVVVQNGRILKSGYEEGY
jgi:hypothetical protein